MEESKSKSTDEDEIFLDASDEFPFYDCLDEPSDPPNPSAPQSTISLSSSPPKSNHIESPMAGTLRRRKSLALRERNPQLCNNDFKGSIRVQEKGVQKLSSESTSASVVESGIENESVRATTTEEKKEETLRESNDSNSNINDHDIDGGQFNFLVFLAEFIVKAIGFQFNLLISLITFPFWALYYTCMIAINPFYVVTLGRGYLIRKLKGLWNVVVGDILSPYLSEWFKEHKWVLQYGLRCGWGLFWSIYVGFVLVSLLVSAFVVSGLMMRYCLVEAPFQLRQGLNFDFTRSKPVAFVPVTVCPAVECGDKSEVGYGGGGGGVRVVPPNHKLQATVTFVLPESDYNRNLGIFQVRVDFLSDNGKSLASLSHPCMLQFKSEPIRLLLTFFKLIPLVTGYVSETQTLNLKFRGYKEAVIPTACLKVTIEQRAEFRPGAGIPEVYDAFLHLESELPFFKRMLWYWRKTIFVWLSMMLFVVELLFALVCCRPLIIPRGRTRDNAPRSSPQTNPQAQR